MFTPVIANLSVSQTIVGPIVTPSPTGVVAGTSGADTLYALTNGTVYGYAGDDTIWGAAGDEYLSGGAGADRIAGGWGNDTLLGGDGNDRLDGGDGRDRLLGGDGSDALVDGGGADHVDGGLMNDIFYVTQDSAVDTFVGGAGDDILWLSNRFGSMPTIAQENGAYVLRWQGESGWPEADIVSGIERFYVEGFGIVSFNDLLV